MWWFALQKYIFASNTFLHQIHFCIKYIFASNTFLHQIHFCTVFVFCCEKNTAASNIFLHQIHFCTAFVFCCAKNTAASLFFAKQKTQHFSASNILLCWTFSFGKCDAEHFPLENVQHQQNVMQKYIFAKRTFSKGKCTQKCIWCVAKMHLMRCKNAFDALQKCIFASNAFLQRIKCIFATHQMHFCNATHSWTFYKVKCTPKCICNILLVQKCCVFCFAKNKDAALTFCWCWTFSFGKCDAEHFTKSNVRVAKMHLMRCKNAFLQRIKCIFANQNVRKRQNAFWLCKNAFDAKMHFCNAQPKFILTSNAFLHSWTFSFASKTIL